MAKEDDVEASGSHVGKQKALKRYFNTGTNREETPAKKKPVQKVAKNARGKKQSKKIVISGKEDPFVGDAPIPADKLEKFSRGEKNESKKLSKGRLKDIVIKSEENTSLAQKQAARYDLLLPEEAGFLEGDDGEDTCTISQEDIAEAVDITAGSKYFNLTLNQFGPYQLDYTINGRHLILGGRRGHIAAMDWHTKQLLCEINVMETVNDIKWLHTEAMFAVAQKKWLYIYDNQGIELHCLKKFNDVLRMEFLPYHFLLATASATGFLQYLDISVGKEVNAINAKCGRLDVMAQNPQNAIIHLGHPTGTVTLWSPRQKEPLVKMLCHRGGVRSVAVDNTGTYMVTSGLDRKLKVFDVRTFQALKSYVLPAGSSSLSISQRGLLACGSGNTVQVYKSVWETPVNKPYMAHSVKGSVWGVRYCPFEDVLGIGHTNGFSSMLVPGAGEANFDALESNPFHSVKQRQEWEVKALLDKIQPELITLDPSLLGKVDKATLEQRHKDKVERLGYDPLSKEKFIPRKKMKGRSSSGSTQKRKKKVAYDEQRELIQQAVESREKAKKEQMIKEKMTALGQRKALDRFKKSE
ncbi:WD repeat-containing protein 46 [Erpetoichthys calabaricus]|uniref:WD repeat-containing protein 46 n=1 Tax=Erpetoichthys calabaricus TaxID=27687 RepID=A0A8C4RD46_ERPCA|nr:WD repeat-containing protein 46 [Erpetoichthys calabaricus]